MSAGRARPIPLNPARRRDETNTAMCTEQCGRLEPPDERELIAAFEATARASFGFCESELSLRPTALSTFGHRPTGWKMVEMEEAQYPFLARLAYAGPGRGVRVSYGGRDYRLEVDVADAGGNYRLLTDWLQALGAVPRQAEDSGVASPVALAHHSGLLARLLRRHYTAITQIDASVVEASATLGRSRDQAHAAFAAGGYGAYVALMAPFEDALTATERKKLDFARAKTQPA